MMKQSKTVKTNQITNLITQENIQNQSFVVRFHPNLPLENQKLIALEKGLIVPSQTCFTEFTKLSFSEQQKLLNFETISKIDFFVKTINNENSLPVPLSIASKEFLNKVSRIQNFRSPKKNGWFRSNLGSMEFISDKKYNLKRKKQAILALHYVQMINIQQISKKLKISSSVVRTLLKKFNNSPREVLDSIKTDDLKPVEELNLISIINQILKTQQRPLNAKRIQSQLEDFLHLQFSKSFRINQFLKKNGFRYKRIQKHKPVASNLSSSKQAFLSFVLIIIIENLPLFCFDVSTVMDGSFAKKSWFKTGGNFTPNNIYRYDFIHILGLISSTGISGLKFIMGKLCHRSIACFFIDVIENLRKRIPISNSIYVIIDNAPVNKSTILKKLCTQMNVILIFIVPSSPELNPIELFWRDIKLSLRKEYYLSRNLVYDRLLTECKSLQESRFASYQKSLLRLWLEIMKETDTHFETNLV